MAGARGPPTWCARVDGAVVFEFRGKRFSVLREEVLRTCIGAQHDVFFPRESHDAVISRDIFHGHSMFQDLLRTGPRHRICISTECAIGTYHVLIDFFVRVTVIPAATEVQKLPIVWNVFHDGLHAIFYGGRIGAIEWVIVVFEDDGGGGFWIGQESFQYLTVGVVTTDASHVEGVIVLLREEALLEELLASDIILADCAEVGGRVHLQTAKERVDALNPVVHHDYIDLVEEIVEPSACHLKYLYTIVLFSRNHGSWTQYPRIYGGITNGIRWVLSRLWERYLGPQRVLGLLLATREGNTKQSQNRRTDPHHPRYER